MKVPDRYQCRPAASIPIQTRRPHGHRGPHQSIGHQPADRRPERRRGRQIHRHVAGLLTAVAAKNLVYRTAEKQQVHIWRGVYLATTGPSYETPAEIKAFAWVGADAVGMSTVPEVIVARYHNIEVAGVSCITNLAAGISSKKLSLDAESAGSRPGGARQTRKTPDRIHRLVVKSTSPKFHKLIAAAKARGETLMLRIREIPRRCSAPH